MTTTAIALRTDNLTRYIEEVQKYPLLSRDEELALAWRFRETGDVTAAHELVVSNLRFVVKVAKQFSGYGLRLLDLIQEGNVGLMVAVKKFDPGRGYRLISYAVWWIRAHIQAFILNSWSLVKLGTTRTQRKLFFKLRSARNKLERETRGHVDADTRASDIAEMLDVPESEVSNMEARIAARDFSLDRTMQAEGQTTFLERLPTDDMAQDEAVASKEEHLLLEGAVSATADTLDERERYILDNRLLAQEPETLQDIGTRFKLTRERTRQIEQGVVKKLRQAMPTRLSGETGARARSVSP